jgi:hypothetical protein
MQKTKLHNVFLGGTYFDGTDLRGATGFDTAKALEDAIFREAIVTNKEKEQIESRKTTQRAFFVVTDTVSQLRK